MAASDQTYRNQKKLDVVFGVSCGLMLLSIGLMFWDDYNRPYKKEQRIFRDVREAMAQRAALAAIPDPQLIAAAQKEVQDAEQEQDDSAIAGIERDMQEMLADKMLKERAYQTVKADYDSFNSLYDIAVEKHGKTSPEAAEYRRKIDDARKRLGAAQADFDEIRLRFEMKQLEKVTREKRLK